MLQAIKKFIYSLFNIEDANTFKTCVRVGVAGVNTDEIKSYNDAIMYKFILEDIDGNVVETSCQRSFSGRYVTIINFTQLSNGNVIILYYTSEGDGVKPSKEQPTKISYMYVIVDMNGEIVKPAKPYHYGNILQQDSIRVVSKTNKRTAVLIAMCIENNYGDEEYYYTVIDETGMAVCEKLDPEVLGRVEGKCTSISVISNNLVIVDTTDDYAIQDNVMRYLCSVYLPIDKQGA